MNSQPPASSLPSRNNRIVSASVSSLGKPSQKFLLNTWPPIGTSLTGLPEKAVLYSPKLDKHNGKVVREVLGHCLRWRKTMKLGCESKSMRAAIDQDCQKRKHEYYHDFPCCLYFWANLPQIRPLLPGMKSISGTPITGDSGGDAEAPGLFLGVCELALRHVWLVAISRKLSLQMRSWSV